MSNNYFEKLTIGFAKDVKSCRLFEEILLQKELPYHKLIHYPTTNSDLLPYQRLWFITLPQTLIYCPTSNSDLLLNHLIVYQTRLIV